MKKISIVLLIISATLLMGCASTRQPAYFPPGALDQSEATRISELLTKLGQPPLWPGADSPEVEINWGVSYRLIVVPTWQPVVCMSVADGRGTDQFLRTQVFQQSYEYSDINRPRLLAERLLFDESTLLTYEDFLDLQSEVSAIDWATLFDDVPNKALRVFSTLDGCSFILESNVYGRYRITRMCDVPRTFAWDEKKDVLLEFMPEGTNLTAVRKLVEAYARVLEWFAGHTDLKVLEGYRPATTDSEEDQKEDSANKPQEDTSL